VRLLTHERDGADRLAVVVGGSAAVDVASLLGDGLGDGDLIEVETDQIRVLRNRCHVLP